MKIDDLEMEVWVLPKTLSRSRDYAERVFNRLQVDITRNDRDDSSSDQTVGHLDCFLLDVISAEKYDDDIQLACDEEDGEVSTFACFALTQGGLVRGKLLAFLDKTPAAEADDDNIDVANILCVNGGWFALSPEVLAHSIARLRETFRFDYVVVDTLYVLQGKCKDWRQEKGRSSLKMPPPFVEVVWGILAPEDKPTKPERSFSVARVNQIRMLSDRFQCRRAKRSGS